MTSAQRRRLDEAFMRNAVNSSLRIGVLLLLVIFCLRVVGPFINLTLWAIIVAVALYPVQQRLNAMIGNRPRLSSAIVVLVVLAVLVAPVVAMTESTIASVRSLSDELRSGQLSIPPPSEKVTTWPLVGERLYGLWKNAADNLQQTVNQFKPQLVAAGEWLLKAIGGAAAGIFAFIASIILAGFLMVSADACHAWARKLVTELAGDRGQSLTELSIATIRSVAQGVLGVAIIQTLLAGIGFFVMDVPAMGILIAILLMIAIMQVPTLILIGPIVIWVYSIAEPGPATLFAIYMLFVSLSDNFLKPLLLGRGVEIPTLVILIGAIGGAIHAGVIGLFLGAVTLALAYELLVAWMNPDTVEQTLAEISERP